MRYNNYNNNTNSNRNTRAIVIAMTTMMTEGGKLQQQLHNIFIIIIK